jgi:hypothetical protein
MYWIYYLILVVVLLAGLYINLVGAPGLWVMVAATLGYAWATHWNYAGFRTLATIIVIAGIAEILEFFASGAAAKRAGASRRGIIGALIGGIVGAIFLTIPWPIIGTIIGVCIGTFLGALTGELTVGKELGGSVRVGFGAVAGRLLGTFIKLLFGCTILGIVLFAAFPVKIFGKNAAPLPTLRGPTVTTAPAGAH